MDSIGKRVANITPESAPTWTQCTGKQLPTHWQTALFDRFKAIYRRKWTDQFDTPEEVAATMREWAEALADYTGEQIKAGIEGCRDNLAFPPSIAEFKRFVREAEKPAYHRPFPPSELVFNPHGFEKIKDQLAKLGTRPKRGDPGWTEEMEQEYLDIAKSLGLAPKYRGRAL